MQQLTGRRRLRFAECMLSHRALAICTEPVCSLQPGGLMRAGGSNMTMIITVTTCLVRPVVFV